ncbi:MAG: leucine-rich repeat domain-containing protein [Clostridia bacterium]|nr:leucine-rich repeat domain-containing protein [Clostridia bacterium]
MRNKKIEFFDSCPCCGRRLAFYEEHTQTVKNCPCCGAPIRFEADEEECKYRIFADLSGESFCEDGFVVENGVLVRYEGKEEKIATPFGVLMIGEKAFENNRSLKEITVSEGVLYIGTEAFSHAENIRKLTLPSGLSAIGNCAFWNCRRLESIAVPASVRAMGYGLFHGCENLENAELPMEIPYVGGWIYGFCKRLKRAVVPSGRREVDHHDFSESEQIEELVIGRGVQRIHGYMCHLRKLARVYFEDPTGWQTQNTNFGGASNAEDIPERELKNQKKAAQRIKKFSGIQGMCRAEAQDLVMSLDDCLKLWETKD